MASESLYPLHKFALTKNPSEEDLKEFDKLLDLYEAKAQDGIPHDIACRHPFGHLAARQGSFILLKRFLERFPHLAHSSRYTDVYGLSVMERVAINNDRDSKAFEDHLGTWRHIWKPYYDAKITHVEQIIRPSPFSPIARLFTFYGHLVPLT